LHKRWLTFIFIAGTILALDQITKTLVTENLEPGQSWAPIPAIASVFKITHSANSGAAFSLFQGGNLPLLLLALAMLIGIIFFFAQSKPEERLQQLALVILFGGVSGNVTDRLRFGAVVDFIHWQIPGVISNVSNLADHAIVFSIFLLLLASRQTVRYPSQNETPDSAARPAHPDSVRDTNPHP
jgi:signal peptidase II